MTNRTIFEIRRTNKFEKSLKKSIKKGLDIELLKTIVFKLSNEIPYYKLDFFINTQISYTY